MTALDYALENKYDALSKYETVKEFNNHFEQAMLHYKKVFTKSEYIALNNLRKFAGVTDEGAGVAFCKVIKAVASTYKNTEFGVSRRTFERMLVRAKSINLIRVINQERPDGGQKHNVYVFNRFEELVAPEPRHVGIVSKSHTIDVPNTGTIGAPISMLLYLPRLRDIITYPQAESVPVKVPGKESSKDIITPYQQMRALVDGLFSDRKTIYRMYGAWLGQTGKMIGSVPFDIALKATRVLVREVKRRVSLELLPLYNPAGYFSGILTKMIDRWLEEERARYEKDWEQAMIEDGFEPDLLTEQKYLESVGEGEQGQKVISAVRMNRAEQYLERKREELEHFDTIRLIKRRIRLFKYEELLNGYLIDFSAI